MPYPSHPVPDLPGVGARLRRVRALAVSERLFLAADRVNYLVGETPFYEIRNAPPEEQVRWTIVRDGHAPVEYADAAQRTDADGRWHGPGAAWTHASTGFYTITAQVGDWSARTSFTVIETFPRAPEIPAANLIGVVHVAGDYRFAGPGSPLGGVPFLVEGAQQILNLGARRGVFYLTPQYKTSDYRFDDFGSSPIRSLVELADSPPYRMLFEQPFEEFVLTAYTFANWEWVLDRARGGASVSLRAEEETAEMAGLAAFLARRYPGKRFVLKNWEGDWQLLGSFDPEASVAPERIDEFVEWLRARQAGVVGTPSVRHAIEFNLLSRFLRGEPGMLRDVIRRVESDAIAYSSWETNNAFDTRWMKDAIAFLGGMPGSEGREVMIAEFGAPNDSGAAGTHLQPLLRAFADAGVKAYLWQIFNNGVPYGLIGPEYQRFDTWFQVRESLAPVNDAVPVGNSALPSMQAGETVSVVVTFRNTGQPWYQSVGYQVELLGPGGADLGEAAWLPHDVANGEQATFRFDFTAPQQPGTYRFQMAQRGIEVFGEPLLFDVQSG